MWGAIHVHLTAALNGSAGLVSRFDRFTPGNYFIGDLMDRIADMGAVRKVNTPLNLPGIEPCVSSPYSRLSID
jgi:hypothetical protein